MLMSVPGNQDYFFLSGRNGTLHSNSLLSTPWSQPAGGCLVYDCSQTDLTVTALYCNYSPSTLHDKQAPKMWTPAVILAHLLHSLYFSVFHFSYCLDFSLSCIWSTKRHCVTTVQLVWPFFDELPCWIVALKLLCAPVSKTPSLSSHTASLGTSQ